MENIRERLMGSNKQRTSMLNNLKTLKKVENKLPVSVDSLIAGYNANLSNGNLSVGQNSNNTHIYQIIKREDRKIYLAEVLGVKEGEVEYSSPFIYEQKMFGSISLGQTQMVIIHTSNRMVQSAESKIFGCKLDDATLDRIFMDIDAAGRSQIELGIDSDKKGNEVAQAFVTPRGVSVQFQSMLGMTNNYQDYISYLWEIRKGERPRNKVEFEFSYNEPREDAMLVEDAMVDCQMEVKNVAEQYVSEMLSTMFRECGFSQDEVRDLEQYLTCQEVKDLNDIVRSLYVSTVSEYRSIMEQDAEDDDLRSDAKQIFSTIMSKLQNLAAYILKDKTDVEAAKILKAVSMMKTKPNRELRDGKEVYIDPMSSGGFGMNILPNTYIRAEIAEKEEPTLVGMRIRGDGIKLLSEGDELDFNEGIAFVGDAGKYVIGSDPHTGRLSAHFETLEDGRQIVSAVKELQVDDINRETYDDSKIVVRVRKSFDLIAQAKGDIDFKETTHRKKDVLKVNEKDGFEKMTEYIFSQDTELTFANYIDFDIDTTLGARRIEVYNAILAKDGDDYVVIGTYACESTILDNLYNGVVCKPVFAKVLDNTMILEVEVISRPEPIKQEKKEEIVVSYREQIEAAKKEKVEKVKETSKEDNSSLSGFRSGKTERTRRTFGQNVEPKEEIKEEQPQQEEKQPIITERKARRKRSFNL